MAPTFDAERVKAINRIFHDVEADGYEEAHPEIYAVEGEGWRTLYMGAFPQGSGRTLLDIGTGNGFVPEVLTPLLTERDTVIFSDLSPKMLDSVRSRFSSARYQKQFLLCDASNVPLPDGSVDVITLNSVLHHIPDYPDAFKEFDRLLRPGGFLIIKHEPNSRFAASRVLSGLFRLVRFLKDRRYEQHGTLSEFQQRVVAALRKEGITFPEGTLFSDIQALVDIESPTAAHNLDGTRGFDPYDLQTRFFPSYTVREVTTYNYFAKLDDQKTALRKVLSSVLRWCYPGRGYFFDFVIQK